MERIKKEEKVKTLLWKKIGGGSIRLNGRIIKSGQTFEAKAEDIPKAFKDLLIPVNQGAIQASKKQVEKSSIVIPEVEFTLQMVKAGVWNVIDENEKVINEKSLSKKEAENLIIELKK